MDITRLDPDELDRIRPAWLALCEHLGEIDTGMGPLRSPEELWARRRGHYARWLRQPASAMFVAQRDGEVLGYAMVQQCDPWPVRETSDPTGELQTVSVLPGARGRGAGTALLRAGEAHLRAHGVRDLTVGVSTANAGALRWYAREGFRPAMSTWWARPVPALPAGDVAIEAVAARDVDALEPLHDELMARHEAVRPPYLPPPRPMAEVWRHLRPGMTGDDAIVLRAREGYVHAAIGGDFDVWDTGRVGTIRTLVVKEGARGRGTGAALMARACEVLRRRHGAAVELDVLEGNERAERFYARLGLARVFETRYKRL